MRIAINAQPYIDMRSGIAQYLKHLTQELQLLYPDDHIFQMLSPAPSEHVPDNDQIEIIPAKFKNQRLNKIWWEQSGFPTFSHHKKAEIIHVPYSAPIVRSSIPTIVTIHDVIPLKIPAYRNTRVRKIYSAFFSWAAKYATQIITVSEYSKQDIHQTLRIPLERISVTYEAANQTGITAGMPVNQIIREKYGISGRFIFYIGGFDIRKNVAKLVEAFAQVVKLYDRNVTLLIAGDTSWLDKGDALYPDWRPLAEQLGIMQNIMAIPVSDNEKNELYSACDCFVYPSMYEGFGLPPLEAMSSGAPVICSNSTSLPEVVGEAALLVNGNSADELTQAILSVLESDNLAQTLRQKGLERSRQFTWTKTAQETYKIYEKVLSESLRI